MINLRDVSFVNQNDRVIELYITAGRNGGQVKRYLMRAEDADIAVDWCQV